MRPWPSFSASPSTSSNKVSASSNFCEVRYPFGVQNDLGQVVLRGPTFVSVFTLYEIIVFPHRRIRRTVNYFII